MTPTRRRRLIFASTLIVGVAIATTLVVMALKENMLFFYRPAEVVAGAAPTDAVFRVGGMVVDGSVQRSQNSLEVAFDLTDYEQTITVHYDGILPDLFREGQGIIAQGRLQEGAFVATEVLAKHDENYMPPEVADAIHHGRQAGAAE